MLTSLACLAAMTLVPGQGGVTLSNPRVTYGELGASRPDVKFLPGDILRVGFDIDGIKVDDTGKVKYSMGMELVDKDNKAIFVEEPRNREDFLPLGGTKLPARAYVKLALDQAPGIYACRVTVVDSATKTSKTLEQKFEVLKSAFGLVRVETSADLEAAIPAPALGVAGQQIFVHFVVVGFGRDQKTKQPDVTVQMAIFNKDGTPTVQKPTTETINNGTEPNDAGIPLRFLLPMNRIGDFTIELKATDNLSKTTAKVTLPVKVLMGAN